MCIMPDWYKQAKFFLCTVTKATYASKIFKFFRRWQTTRRSWQTEYNKRVKKTYLSSGALYWRKQQFINTTNFVRNGCCLPNEEVLFQLGITIIIWTQNCSQRKYSQVHVAVGMLEFVHVRWVKKVYCVESLVLETRTWTFLFWCKCRAIT